MQEYSVMWMLNTIHMHCVGLVLACPEAVLACNARQ
jgi:hypothetical protein